MSICILIEIPTEQFENKLTPRQVSIGDNKVKALANVTVEVGKDSKALKMIYDKGLVAVIPNDCKSPEEDGKLVGIKMLQDFWPPLLRVLYICGLTRGEGMDLLLSKDLDPELAAVWHELLTTGEFTVSSVESATGANDGQETTEKN